MNYYYKVEFTGNDGKGNCSSGEVGLVHTKKCTNTTIKAVLKKIFPGNKKEVEINITKAELISEEEATRLFGNKIISVNFKSRLVR